MHLQKKHVLFGIFIIVSLGLVILTLELAQRVTKKITLTLLETEIYQDDLTKLKDYLFHDQKMRDLAIRASDAFSQQGKVSQEEIDRYKDEFTNYLNEKGMSEERIKAIVKEMLKEKESVVRGLIQQYKTSDQN